MFLSREFDLKLCQIYTKIHIYAILYKSSIIKQIIFHKYETNLKTNDDIPQKSENLRFAPESFNFYFAFLIDIIDDIITYSPDTQYYVTITSANDSAIFWSRDFRLYHMTRILQFHRWKILVT